jgi:hypothetical protein
MVMLDSNNPPAPHVFVRGNPARLGAEVPRRFPQILAGADSPAFPHGSGRLDLARAIVDRDNPLTPRVIANRVWLHHFGRGLVSTPSDFGKRGDLPTHPDLLDYLAWQLMEHGWSIKQLHRRIMLSSVYRQSSDDDPQARAVDPENRLLWRMPRQRLDLEAMRDSLLAVSGRLDPALNGRPVDYISDSNIRRRSVYGFVNRNDLPNMFRVFDFADPDSSSPQRPQTTVPQQALFAMNSPFVIQQAREVAASPAVAGQTDAVEKVHALYRRVLSRDPDSGETELAMQFVSAQKTDDVKMSPWEKLAQVLLLTNEFLFVD